MFPCPYIFVTVFLIDVVWCLIWLVVTAGSMGMIEVKCESLSLSDACKQKTASRCVSSLPSHVDLLVGGPGIEVVGAEAQVLDWCCLCEAACLHHLHVPSCSSGL